MKKTLVVALLILACGVLSSLQCKEPDWLSGVSKKYPQSSYLIGVGMGTSLSSAKDDAMAQISKVFNAAVQQTAMDTNKEKTTKSGKKKEFSSEVSAETQTTVTTTGKLEGVEIAETWANDKKHQYYALAVLNKPRMRQDLSQQIEDIEEQIHQSVDAGKKASSNIAKAAGFGGALKLMDKKAELVNKRKVVDQAYIPDLDSGYSAAEVKKMKDDAIKNIVFVVDSGSRLSLAAMINDRITKMGFRVIQSVPLQPDKSLTVISIKCSEDVSPFDRGNSTWKFYNWKVSAEMKEMWAADGTFAAISEQGESSHLSDETAKSKAYIDADSTLAQSIERRIRQNILGE